MRHNQIIKLISITVAEDAIGNQVETPTERQVFANEFSVGSSEFYKAAVTGLRPSKMFEVYSWEYQDEDRLSHNSATYRIIRTEAKSEKTRLICEKVTADG